MKQYVGKLVDIKVLTINFGPFFINNKLNINSDHKLKNCFGTTKTTIKIYL